MRSDIRKYEEGIDYYQTKGSKLATETIFHANKSYQNGEINFFQYTQLLENAKNIQSNYLHTLLQYNVTVLEANYILN